MEKILFITAFTPSELGAAVKNTKIMLSDLSLKYEVDLVYFKYASDPFYAPDSPNINVSKVVNCNQLKKIVNCIQLPFLHPFFTVRYDWATYLYLQKLVKRNKYKAIICDHSQVQVYGRLLKCDAHKFLICHDIIYQRVSRVSSKFLAWFTRISENWVLQTNNSTAFSFSQKDCDLLSSVYGIDAKLCLDYIDEKIEKYDVLSVEDYYVFFAFWGRADNHDGLIWFYKNVVPQINFPTHIKIIGKGLKEEWVYNNNTLVKTEILGFVDDPYPIISKAKALLSPLFSGAGIKVKVMESLACGTPVIGTEIAFEGFDEKYKRHMLLCNEPQDYLSCMQCQNESLEERRKFKQMFIRDYQSKTMPVYVGELCIKNVE